MTLSKWHAALAAALVAGSMNVTALEGTAGDMTMNLVDRHAARPHLPPRAIEGLRDIITDYQIANGDLTEEQLAEMEAQREALREELHALRESGDYEALEARLAELRADRIARQEALRDYVAAHEDLRLELQSYRAAVRSEFRDRLRERLHDDTTL
ncbi:MAG: hypothetical protein H6978_06370 [Gammaproteobacteria bacterium]|nr:hypothetical protein [Gammaproteobacteria bacterium]